MIRRDFRCPGPTPAAAIASPASGGPPPAARSCKRDMRRSLGRDGAAHPLLGEIERVQRAQRLSDCQFGLRSAGDPNLVTRIREGSWPRAATVAKVRAWILGSLDIARDERESAE